MRSGFQVGAWLSKFNTDGYSAAISALDAMGTPMPAIGGNVVPLRR